MISLITMRLDVYVYQRELENREVASKDQMKTYTEVNAKTAVCQQILLIPERIIQSLMKVTGLTGRYQDFRKDQLTDLYKIYAHFHLLMQL